MIAVYIARGHHYNAMKIFSLLRKDISLHDWLLQNNMSYQEISMLGHIFFMLPKASMTPVLSGKLYTDYFKSIGSVNNITEITASTFVSGSMKRRSTLYGLSRQLKDFNAVKFQNLFAKIFPQFFHEKRLLVDLLNFLLLVVRFFITKISDLYDWFISKIGDLDDWFHVKIADLCDRFHISMICFCKIILRIVTMYLTIVQIILAIIFLLKKDKNDNLVDFWSNNELLNLSYIMDMMENSKLDRPVLSLILVIVTFLRYSEKGRKDMVALVCFNVMIRGFLLILESLICLDGDNGNQAILK